MSEGKNKFGSHKQDVEKRCYSIAFVSTVVTHIEDDIFTIKIFTHNQFLSIGLLLYHYKSIVGMHGQQLGNYHHLNVELVGST